MATVLPSPATSVTPQPSTPRHYRTEHWFAQGWWLAEHRSILKLADAKRAAEGLSRIYRRVRVVTDTPNRRNKIAVLYSWRDGRMKRHRAHLP